MGPAETVRAYVHDALAAGRARDEIAAALGGAGWSDDEVAQGLAAWDGEASGPPVPVPQPYVSARDVVVYALMLIALGFSAGYLVLLLHVLIDRTLGDLPQGRAAGTIRWSIAFLAVFGPLYAWLTWRDLSRMRDRVAARRSVTRKWAVNLILFAAALVLLGDLIAVIYGFLSGDVTAAFVAKVAAVAAVAGSIFAFYRADMDGAA